MQCACADELMPVWFSRAEPVRLEGGSVCRGACMQERVRLCGASHQWLCGVSSCPGACADELVCVCMRFCAVHAHEGFV